MAQAVLCLRQKNSAWASWSTHWPNFMCVISRKEIATRPTTTVFLWLFRVRLRCSRGEGCSHQLRSQL